MGGIHFPWTYPGVDWAAFEKMSAPAVWDNLPVGARLQIIVGVGILEAYGENSVALEADGEAHYMRGGKPGYYPTFDSRRSSGNSPTKQPSAFCVTRRSSTVASLWQASLDTAFMRTASTFLGRLFNATTIQ